MEGLNEWSEVGRQLGINLSKFESIRKQAYKNIEKIQEFIIKATQNMTQIEVVTDEVVEKYSKVINSLQGDLNKSFDYFPLTALNLVMTVIKRKSRLRNSKVNLKKTLGACLGVRRIIEKMLDRPFRAILHIALFELDMIIGEMKGGFNIEIYSEYCLI